MTLYATAKYCSDKCRSRAFRNSPDMRTHNRLAVYLSKVAEGRT